MAKKIWSLRAGRTAGIKRVGGAIAASAMIEPLEGRALMSATASLTLAPTTAAGAPASEEGIVTRPAMTVLPVTASLTAADAPAAAVSQPGFQISVVFPDSSLTALQKAAFTTAANRWQQIITGDVPDFQVGVTLVDDVQIQATGPLIDGVGAILGQAGPTGLRPVSLLPVTGLMQFDSADLANMEANGTLVNVITHEMGHVLGYGTIWGAGLKNLVTGAGGADPRFTGAAATAEYQSLFGATDETGVPLENAPTAGAGTRDVHWRESTFGNELMSGYIAPGSNPLSRVSAAQFIDLGYTGVVVSAADTFTVPLRVTSLTASGSGVVAPGGSVTLAAGTSDSAGTVGSVSFFRETNGASGLQSTGANADTLVGTDNSSAGGFTIDASLAGLQSGAPYRFYARATDSDGDRSAAGATALFAQGAVAIAGDINLNGTVGPEDFNILASNFGSSGKAWTPGDLTGDGTVGPEDFNLLATNFGQGLPGGISASMLSTETPIAFAAATATTTTGSTNATTATTLLTAATPSAPRYHKHR